MSPRITAQKMQATRGVNGHIFVAMGLGLPVAPIVLKPATIPTGNTKTQNHNGGFMKVQFAKHADRKARWMTAEQTLFVTVLGLAVLITTYRK